MKTFKNYLYNLSYQVLILIVPLVTVPYISRVLQPDGIGKFAYTQSIVEYFILFGLLGMSTFGSRHIACVRDDTEKRYQAFWDLNATKLITMTLSAVAYVIMCLFTNSNQLLFIVQIFTILAYMFNISWYFAGVEKFKLTTTINALSAIISLILILTFVKDKSDLIIYAVIVSVTCFLGQASLWVALKKEVEFRRVNWSNVKLYLVGSFKLWLPTIAASIYVHFDKIILGWLTDDVQVGLYANSQKLVRMATTVTTSLSLVTIPKVSNSYYKGNLNDVKQTVYKSLKGVSFLAFPMCFGLMAIRNTLVPWFFGPGYEQIANLLLVSSLLIITLSWSSILANQVLVATNRENLYTLAIVIAAILNLSLNFILIPKFKAMGALITSVAAEYIGMFIMLYFSRNIISIKRFLVSISKYFITSVIMYTFTFYIGTLLPNTIYTTAIQIIVGVAFYFGLMFILHDSVLFYILDILKSKNKDLKFGNIKEK